MWDSNLAMNVPTEWQVSRPLYQRHDLSARQSIKQRAHDQRNIRHSPCAMLDCRLVKVRHGELINTLFHELGHIRRSRGDDCLAPI